MPEVKRGPITPIELVKRGACSDILSIPRARRLLRAAGIAVQIVLSLLVLAACSRTESPTATVERAISTPVQLPTETVSESTEPAPTAAPTVEATRTATVTVSPPLLFDGESAFAILLDQMEMGPRWPDSEGHKMVGDYIIERLQEEGWSVEEQLFPYQGLTGRNIIARKNAGSGPAIMIGAHYDSRKVADQSPNTSDPVPGANDGASGVAVLLELARTLELDETPNEIWLTFFDLEDQGSGGMPDFNYIAGSSYMAENLQILPEAMVLVDMIGDADQQLYYEGNSNPELRETIWQIADALGYSDFFIKEVNHTMLDDHLPFGQLGIPAVDIIDFDYPYWHTVDDTADKVSPESLERVGRTLEQWIENKQLQ